MGLLLALGGGLLFLVAAAARSGSRTNRPATREEIMAVADEAVANGDLDTADALVEHAANAPSATEPTTTETETETESESEIEQEETPPIEAPTAQEETLDSELAQLPAETRALVNQMLTEDRTSQLPLMRQTSELMTTRGYEHVAAALEAQIETIANSAPLPPTAPSAPSTPVATDSPSATPNEPSTPANAPSSAMDTSSPLEGAHPQYNPAEARALAPALARMITADKYNYNRNALKGFQRLAGITDDGLYGPQSEAALRYYLQGSGIRAPRRLYGGSVTTYEPPTS